MVRKFLTAAAVFAVLAFAPRAQAQAVTQCPAGARSVTAYFETGSAVLGKEGYPNLGFALRLAQPNGHIALNGHTDGSEPATLGAARASAISELFSGAGVAAGRLSATGFGFNHPAVNVPGPEAQNRRVEICITPGS